MNEFQLYFILKQFWLPTGQKFAGETKYKDYSEKKIKLDGIPWQDIVLLKEKKYFSVKF